ncbi:hypothetical protein F1645_13640 [Novacetimonas hansenii]
MLAIVVSPCCYRAATTVASMAIDQPEASGRAPFRAAAQRRTAGPELSCFARNDGAAVRGRKFWNAVAASRSRRSRMRALVTRPR